MKKTIRNMQGRAGSARGAATETGFTLIEMLIAVGALALIAAGVGAIFQATGRTIQAGKRVSAFGQYVNLIKAQMREDFALMSREGFLVIRNEYADANGNGSITIQSLPISSVIDEVPLYDEDLRPRLRRTDEIMFFAKGQFVSARELIDPGSIARADAARIYYGHGQRAVPPAGGYSGSPTDPYYAPDVDDSNVGSSAGAGRLGYYNSGAPVPNPNRFASDWILARHVTLLRPPQTSAPVLPTPRPFGLSVQELTDSEVQGAMQPAASSIFRALTVGFPLTSPVALRQSFDGGYDHPQFSSGLVDIASTDLSLIRSIVMTCGKFPSLVTPASFYLPLQNQNPPANELQNAGPDGMYQRFANDSAIVNRMQNWMEEGLPTWSTATNNQKTRVRVERAPTNFVGVVSDGTLTPVEKAARRADQVMLASAGFLPRCTEFIVEWSFGKQYPSDSTDPNYVQGREGQYIWHGLFRDVNGQTISDLYDSTNPFVAFSQSATRVDGGSINQVAPTQLIHGNGPFNAGGPLTSYFGYVDPYFNPDSNNDGDLNDPADSRVTTLPWAWPKLIRVTLSLADPNDPSIEQSFQFVFEVPEAK